MTVKTRLQTCLFTWGLEPVSAVVAIRGPAVYCHTLVGFISKTLDFTMQPEGLCQETESKQDAQSHSI